MTVHLLQLIVFFLFFFIKRFGCQDENFPIITIEDGSIRGMKAHTIGEQQVYYSFRGIPYAQPPIGNLRFKNPVKNFKWNGTLDATDDKSECTQGSFPSVGSEDCLYINVYTPSLNKTGYAVMVWIYGGSFINGNSSYQRFGPDYLLEQGVIFVSFNYRLGAFGFLSTEDLSCPGNMALRDQTLALKWVQTNIKYFGGNASLVTVFGESAGSVSVSYLLQSKYTKGLFRAAIMESGTSLCLWGLNRRARETAFSLGADLGILTTNSSELIEKLRHVNSSTLQDASTVISSLIMLDNPLAGISYGPVIEPPHEGAFFSNYSDYVLRQGRFHKVPLLLGFNSNEAAAVGDIPGYARPYLLNYDIAPSKLTPADLTNNTITRAVVGVIIKNHYFSLLPITVQSDAIISFVSSDQFNRPIRQTVLDTMNYTSVYFYKFSYEGVLGGTVNRTFSGVGHAEELGYIFRTFHNYQTPQNDSLIRARMVRMWTNFAKYLNPTPIQDPILQNVTWNRAQQQSNLSYLNITINMTNEVNPFKSDMLFWDGIYAKYGTPPYNTY